MKYTKCITLKKPFPKSTPKETACNWVKYNKPKRNTPKTYGVKLKRIIFV
jgi:hypothetical protein